MEWWWPLMPVVGILFGGAVGLWISAVLLDWLKKEK